MSPFTCNPNMNETWWLNPALSTTDALESASCSNPIDTFSLDTAASMGGPHHATSSPDPNHLWWMDPAWSAGQPCELKNPGLKPFSPLSNQATDLGDTLRDVDIHWAAFKGAHSAYFKTKGQESDAPETQLLPPLALLRSTVDKLHRGPHAETTMNQLREKTEEASINVRSLILGKRLLYSSLGASHLSKHLRQLEYSLQDLEKRVLSGESLLWTLGNFWPTIFEAIIERDLYREAVNSSYPSDAHSVPVATDFETVSAPEPSPSELYTAAVALDTLAPSSTESTIKRKRDEDPYFINLGDAQKKSRTGYGLTTLS